MIRRLLARMGSDAGMTTAEYAVGTVIPERYLGPASRPPKSRSASGYQPDHSENRERIGCGMWESGMRR
jgi:hypothetical protein